MGQVVRVWGKDFPVPDKLTLRETADIERLLDGAPPDSPGAKLRMQLATVWISCRRVDPTATLEAVGELTVDDFEVVTVPDPPAEPPTGETAGSANPETSGIPSSSASTESSPGT